MKLVMISPRRPGLRPAAVEPRWDSARLMIGVRLGSRSAIDALYELTARCVALLPVGGALSGDVTEQATAITLTAICEGALQKPEALTGFIEIVARFLARQTLARQTLARQTLALCAPVDTALLARSNHRSHKTGHGGN